MSSQQRKRLKRKNLFPQNLKTISALLQLPQETVLKTFLKDLGSDNVVSGGPSMNPSTDDIYEAIMATPAKNVLVLPKIKKILAAEQTISMGKDRTVVIVPTEQFRRV